MILSITEDSPLLKSLPPSMLLKIMTMIRSSRHLKTLPAYRQAHICRLAIAYIRAHQEELNASFFVSLATELYFPDFAQSAKEVAMDILEISKDTGWELDESSGLLHNCVAAISQSFSVGDGPNLSQIHELTNKVPQDIITILMAEAFNAKGVSKQKKALNVECRVAKGFVLGSSGLAKNSTFHIRLRPSDSVNHIRYLVSRHLNSSSSTIGIYCKRNKLGGHQNVSKCRITSNTVLDISISA